VSDTIQSVLIEERVFPPPAEFAESARVGSMAAYEAMAARARKDPDGFWAEVAKELTWSTPWQRVLDWQSPDARWFVGARTNITVNCLDRHLDGPRKNKAALLFEGEPGDTRVLTYHQLHRAVCQAANALHDLGVRAGDFVAIYLPMIPEAVIAMLACARIGAPHTVVFGGFSAEALADRVRDSKARVVITADGGWRRGAIVPLKANVDRALTHGEGCPERRARRRGPPHRPGHRLPHQPRRLVARHRRQGQPAPRRAGARRRSTRCSRCTPAAPPASPRASSTPPAATWSAPTTRTKLVFDLRDDDVFWCTADVGWVTGHSYIVYGPLPTARRCDVRGRAQPARRPTASGTSSSAGASGVLHRAHRDPRVHALGRRVARPARPVVAAAARLGRRADQPRGVDVVPRAHRRRRCPIVDTWWQTETGAIMISPLPGATPTKPGSATCRCPASRRRRRQARHERAAPTRAASSSSSGRGRRCCARSSATTSASCRRTSRDPRRVLRRRRRAPRRRRLLLDHGPRRRRDQRRRPPARHDGGRERAWCRTPRSPRPPWSAAPTSSRARPSSRS
jgi:acetyl-CoA synthetase